MQPTFHTTPQLRVLVVDDNIESAEALCGLLQTMDCTTAVAFDGAHGLAAASGFDPHLALIDLEMPDMRGSDVARQFRTRHPGSLTKLICLTGRSGEDTRRLCLAAGFDGFLVKPMLPHTLDAVVSAVSADLV